ncbi:hypothetical protein D051_0524 [Vibrio parahaemolyticus VPCR-2010]|uniref:hypothetical protein n=1 Tax=Vibrio parahaemolyticus TaxID=670 RepID=UPI00038E6092|nr:hypothetical protein D051_0524 [Vibrio parahaemolyticus VPCR-2010]
MSLRYEHPKMTFHTDREDVSIVAVFLKGEQIVSTKSILYFNNQSVPNSGYMPSQDGDHAIINLDGAYQSGYQDILIFTMHDYQNNLEPSRLFLVNNEVQPAELASARPFSTKNIEGVQAGMNLCFHISLDDYFRTRRVSLNQIPSWRFSQKSGYFENTSDTLQSILANSFDYLSIPLKK